MVDANAAQLMLMLYRNRSDESSSSSDEEWETALQERGRRKLRPRINSYLNVVDRYMESEFKSHFRMSRDTFNYLNSILHQDLTRKVPRCPNIPSHHQLMIALWKMATMDSYRSVCDRFNVGRATALRAVRRVVNGLSLRSSNFIQWPKEEEAYRVMRGFERLSRFPRIIGCIDGTHIRIDAPKQNPSDYINRKQYHSIQLQLVCDDRRIITHCYAGHPGSVHDQRVFRLSEVDQYLNDNNKFPHNSHILGDGAYEIHEHLLIPFRNNGHLTDRQKHFNYCHSAARVTVERCIGLLKGRMRSLLHCLPMTRIDLMAQYIVACCVVHNICILHGDELEIVMPSEALEDDRAREINVMYHERRNAGIQKRNAITNNLQRENE